MEIFLIMLLTVTPPATEDNPEPPTIDASLEFHWPAEYGDAAACKAFMKGGSFWHPDGEFYALGNCVERQVEGGGQ